MKQKIFYLIALSIFSLTAFSQHKKPGNNKPLFEGRYADPEGVV